MNKPVILSIVLVLAFYSVAFSQPKLSFDLKKPPKFENKTLGSEKTGNKKFTVPRHFVQNTVTHYNYFFNANNKLNEVLERAKMAHKEDYTQLLPFYNYSLTETAQYKGDLDSVIYKSTAGILIHDLRNDWIDNLYLLIGRAYFLRNSLDSAYLTFQYINYAFSPKEKDGYDKVIGSNANEGGNIFSISTSEKQNIVKKTFSRPPSRNESLMWQIKTYLAMDALPEASSLIETLKNDPLFPSRLNNSLEEVQAFYFYKQRAYDSAATHLENALDNATDKQEQARWEYLLAQLYDKAGRHDMAEKYYNQTIRHTIDPVMEVYARLNAIRQNKSNDNKNIQNAIDELIRMARRDRYLFYRDIIYYTAATIELERDNPEIAKALLKKSVQTSTNNPVQRSKSYLALGDIYFSQKQYPPAKSAYDSINVQYLLPDDAKILTGRKEALEKIVVQLAILERQDSLHRIAAMPEKEREVFIKNMVKRLRRERGMNETEMGFIPGSLSNQNPAAPDLFSSNTSNSSWSFGDASLKGKGLSDFKAKWGNRPNVDNWQRQAAVAQATFDRPPAAPGMPGERSATGEIVQSMGELNYETLFNNLPLTPEKQKVSADSVEKALFEVGKSYMNGLEDYYSAIDALEKLIQDFPETAFQEEALFNLYYCYSKVGKPDNQLQIKKLLGSKYPGGKFSSLLADGRPGISADSLQKIKATEKYQDIYNFFIEGDFDKAVAMKRSADSVYGQSYWNPQLLYIEGVYYIRQREDSTAKVVLSKILQLYPTSPMTKKTATLLSVLSRRKEIEDYLTKLQITRPPDDSIMTVDLTPPAPKKQPVVIEQPKKDTTAVAKVEEPVKNAHAAKVKADNAGITKAPVSIKTGAMKTDSLSIVKTNVVDSMRRVDSLAFAKAKADSITLAIANSLALAKARASADSLALAKAEADSVALAKANSLAAAKAKARADSLALAKAEADSIALAKASEPTRNASSATIKTDSTRTARVPIDIQTGKPKAADSVKIVQNRVKNANALYSEDPADAHYIVFVLNKVDPVYVNEARNAFNRYHRERYYSKPIEVTSESLTDDIKLVVMKGFENAAVALDYIEKAKKLTQSDIVPWLTPQKYSFLMITAANLETLQRTKDINAYKTFLQSVYPNQF